MLFIYFILLKSRIALTHSSWVFQNHWTDYKETWYRRQLPLAGPRHSTKGGFKQFQSCSWSWHLNTFYNRPTVHNTALLSGISTANLFQLLRRQPPHASLAKILRTPCSLCEPNVYPFGNERCCSKEEVLGRRPSRGGACTHDSTGTGYSKLMTSFNFISRVELAL